MITGTHAIIYAEDAEKARAFFRDAPAVMTAQRTAP